VFLKATGMLQPGHLDIDYVPYVLVGSSMFGLFMGLYAAASGTLAAGRELILQVKYPHEALLFKQVGQQAANFVIAFVLVLVVMLIYRVIPSPGLILLPVVALPLFFLATAMGLMISMIGVVAIDVSRAWDMVMALLLYATPIIYSDQVSDPFVQTIIMWNPVTHLVCSCRDMVIYGRLFDPLGYAVSSLIALVAFLISWRLFYVSESRLVERIL
jgi:lipopolysaccharide transport system permease protein